MAPSGKKTKRLIDKILVTSTKLGTVTVNLETHRIIDVIDSRETKQVEEWLKSYLNINVVSRDGSQAYASAIRNAHPDAMQVSDCFHLIKNLSDIIAIT